MNSPSLPDDLSITITIQKGEDGKLYCKGDIKKLNTEERARITAVGIAIAVNTIYSLVANAIPDEDRQKFADEYTKVQQDMKLYWGKKEDEHEDNG